MKKMLLLLVFCTVLAAPTFGVPSVYVNRIDGYWEAPGGEFTLTPNAELYGLINETAPFQSFCLELSERIDEGYDWYDVILNDKAVYGGVGPAGDPIDPRTAYLYTEFRAGTLSGYNYTPGPDRKASARALQQAIWHIEEEGEYKDITKLNDAAKAFVALANASGWTDIGNVGVLNLYKAGQIGDDQYLRQDMLVFVPAPGAILLGSIGIGLVGWLRIRRTL